MTTQLILDSKLIETINLLCTAYYYCAFILLTMERALATFRVKTYEKETKPWFGVYSTIIIVSKFD